VYLSFFCFLFFFVFFLVQHLQLSQPKGDAQKSGHDSYFGFLSKLLHEIRTNHFGANPWIQTHREQAVVAIAVFATKWIDNVVDGATFFSANLLYAVLYSVVGRSGNAHALFPELLGMGAGAASVSHLLGCLVLSFVKVHFFFPHASPLLFGLSRSCTNLPAYTHMLSLVLRHLTRSLPHAPAVSNRVTHHFTQRGISLSSSIFLLQSCFTSLVQRELPICGSLLQLERLTNSGAQASSAR
jgi:hypothetical protein